MSNHQTFTRITIIAVALIYCSYIIHKEVTAFCGSFLAETDWLLWGWVRRLHIQRSRQKAKFDLDAQTVTLYKAHHPDDEREETLFLECSLRFGSVFGF